jgi:hypothetical protein
MLILRRRCPRCLADGAAGQSSASAILSCRLHAAGTGGGDGVSEQGGHLYHFVQDPMPGEEVWLVGERPTHDERKYYLVNLSDDTPVKALAATITVIGPSCRGSFYKRLK